MDTRITSFYQGPGLQLWRRDPDGPGANVRGYGATNRAIKVRPRDVVQEVEITSFRTPRRICEHDDSIGYAKTRGQFERLLSCGTGVQNLRR